MMEKFKSRKFLLCVLTLLCATGLCWFGKIGDTVFAAVIGATVAAYLTANVTQKGIVSES